MTRRYSGSRTGVTDFATSVPNTTINFRTGAMIDGDCGDFAGVGGGAGTVGGGRGDNGVDHTLKGWWRSNDIVC